LLLKMDAMTVGRIWTATVEAIPISSCTNGRDLTDPDPIYWVLLKCRLGIGSIWLLKCHVACRAVNAMHGVNIISIHVRIP